MNSNIRESEHTMFVGKTLMITGGTGSFGNAVLKDFFATGIKEIRIFSRDEKKQEDMRIAFNDPRLKFYIGDVRDYGSIHEAMKGVNFVFHAAALKQVPSCEFYPMEAMRTNVMGAENVMNAALANRVERVIVLSTDKAVYPITVSYTHLDVYKRQALACDLLQAVSFLGEWHFRDQSMQRVVTLSWLNRSWFEDLEFRTQRRKAASVES